jgi:hypothetical protein
MGIGGHNHIYLCTLGTQGTHKRWRLIRGDTGSNSQQDVLAL